MVLSSYERDDLIRRVERRLGRTPVPAGQLRDRLVREAVDRTLGALPGDAEATPTLDAATAVLTATSMPDLASRVRLGLATVDAPVLALRTATVGRHTVVALQVPPSAEPVVRTAAAAIGARLSWRPSVRQEAP